MRVVKVIAVSLALAASAFGQEVNSRYELGVRVRALERAWSETGQLSEEAKTARRKLALPFIEGTAQSFFGTDLLGAARALDDASHALVGKGHAYWYDALAVTPTHRLCDASERSLWFQVSEFYEPQNMQDIVFTGGVVGETNPRGKPKCRIDVELNSFSTDPPWTGDLNLRNLGPGDYQVWTSLFNGDFVNAKRTLAVSIVDKRDERLASVESAVSALEPSSRGLERETARFLVELLKSLAAGSTEETDYPAARLLDEVEQVVAAAAKGESWYGLEHSGQFWLALPAGRAKSSPVRVFVPSGLKRGHRVPLVVAFHGAGGSENTFFDMHGEGAIVRMCEQRGWLLAAPRLATSDEPPIEQIVDALTSIFLVGEARVLIVGHSTGVSAGVQTALRRRVFVRAFAALGGGDRLKQPELLSNLRVFAGAGDRDFGRGGAERLHQSLVNGGSTHATLKIYPDCEHLMVVAEALPDVFRFFDEAVGTKQHSPYTAQPKREHGSREMPE